MEEDLYVSFSEEEIDELMRCAVARRVGLNWLDMAELVSFLEKRGLENYPAVLMQTVRSVDRNLSEEIRAVFADLLFTGHVEMALDHANLELAKCLFAGRLCSA